MKCLFIIALLALPLLAEQPVYHFVLLVDRSLSMNPRKSTVIKTVRDIVRSGFQDQVIKGDLIELWTFTSELDRESFLPRKWEPAQQALLAEIPAQFLNREKFQGRTRFAAFAPQLNQWFDTQRNALLILFTDGEDPVMDLPFDIEINESISALKKNIRPANRLFLVSFLVQNGRVSEWRVQSADEQKPFPQLPFREPEPPPVAQAIPEPEPEPIPPVVIELPPGARVIAPPPAATPKEPEPVAAEEPVVATAPQPEVQPKVTEATQAAAEEAKPVVMPPIEQGVAVETPASKVVELKTAPPVQETNIAPAVAANASTNIEPAPPSTETTAAVTAAAEAVVAPVTRSSGNVIYLVMGGILAVAVIAWILLRRKPKSDASLISKSLTRH